MDIAKQVRVGVGVFIIKDGKFLVQQRHGSHDSDTWALPGGGMEFGETFEETAKREVLEETGLHIKNIRFAALTNDIFTKSGKHFATIWMLADWESGTERIMEPKKCRKQLWCTLDTVPTPQFTSWANLFESDFLESTRVQLEA